MEVKIYEIEDKRASELVDHGEVVFEIEKLNHPTPLRSENDVEGSNKFVMPRAYEKCMHEIKNLKIYKDDVWVIGYPKCGTTWTQETVWQICNDLQLDAGGKSIMERFPFLELAGLLPNFPNSVEQVKNMPRPRFIKTHLPVKFLPWQLWHVQPKIVYVMRNPKDAAVSFYHHYKLIEGFKGSKEDFFELYLNGHVEFGDYWTYILQFHKLKDFPNLFTLKYENLKKNMKKTLKLIAKFLGKSLSDEQIEILQKHLDFNSMKDNKNCNLGNIVEKFNGIRDEKGAFIRRGKTDSHKDEMSEEFASKFDQKTSIIFKNCKDLY